MQPSNIQKNAYHHWSLEKLKGMNRHFSKEDIYAAIKHTKNKIQMNYKPKYAKVHILTDKRLTFIFSIVAILTGMR